MTWRWWGSMKPTIRIGPPHREQVTGFGSKRTGRHGSPVVTWRLVPGEITMDDDSALAASRGTRALEISGVRATAYEDVFTSEAVAALNALAHFDADRKTLMTLSGHRTHQVFDRYNIVSEDDLIDAAEMMQTFFREQVERDLIDAAKKPEAFEA